MNAMHGASGLILLLALGACSQASNDEDVARRVIGPAGGIITSVDSVLTVVIPPGALEEELEFFIEPSNEPPPTSYPAYLVRPTPELLFDATITYRTSLPAETVALALGAVDPNAFDQGRGEWVPLPLLRVDPEQGLVTGLDDRISIFYALIDDANSSSTGTTSTDDGMDTEDSGDTGGTGATTQLGTTTNSGTTDSGTTTGSGGASTSTGLGESSGELALSFAMDIQPIINANCECHTAGAPAGLSMVDGFGNLVDVASTEAPGLDRIEPGVPDDSYLWHKVNGTHIGVGGSGNPMPAPAGGLDAGSLATLEAWILEGALP